MTLTATPGAAPRSPLTTARAWLTAALGAVLGLAPHVLHHVGLIAGTAFVTGAGGNALLYALGLLLSVPMLRRLHHRFGTWTAPAIAIAAFTGMFALSAFVIGPAVTGSSPESGRQSPAVTPSAKLPTTTPGHAGHHP
jgi:hypothetical protein